MSGQYKIRRDSKDEGLESIYDAGVKAGTNVLRNRKSQKGGCWEGIKSCIGLIILLSICGLIAVAVTDAQSASCFPHKTLYTTEPVEVRSDDSRFSSQVMRTTPRKAYTVITSKRDSIFQSSCWIRIREGWVLRRPTGSVIKPGSPTQRTTSTTTSNTATTATSSRCYTGVTAYITGSMNIRSGPSTRDSKAGSAGAGESFLVLQSQRNGDYCWLKISKGWIAKTGRVQSTKPAPRTTTTSRASASCGPPPIQGSATFQAGVRRAYNQISRSAKWCNYVTTARARSIGELTSHPWKGGKLDRSERQIEVNPKYASYGSAIEFSSTIIHEACHLHQMNGGRASSEKECYQVQLDYVNDVNPSNVFLKKQLQTYLRQYGG